MLKQLQSWNGVVTLFRKNFLSGIFVLIPFIVIAWISLKVIRFMGTFYLLLPSDWQPMHYFDPFTAKLLNVGITLGITVVFAVLVSLIGWISKQYLGRQLLEILSHVIDRIPVLSAIYGALRQLLKTMSTDGKQQFSRVVYVEYPRKGTWTLAFVTSETTARAIAEGKLLNIYVPTTPNPTSGFHLIVPESEVRDSGLNVEDAFKTILSLGIVHREHETDPA